MIVTDKQYFLEKGLVDKLDLLCKRISGGNKHQNVMLVDGKEGYGKSTLTAAAAYYCGHKLGREVRLYFDIEKMFEDAKKTDNMIFIHDDMAYGGLSFDGYTKMIKSLIKLLLLARKKRHFYFFNIQEMFRLREMIVRRAIGLLHVYSRDEIEIGRFVSFSNKTTQSMYDEWLKKKKKNYYGKTDARGTFPDVLYKVFDAKQYEDLKDQAILTIGEEQDDKLMVKLKQTQHFYATYPMGTQKDKAAHAKVSVRAIQKWVAYNINTNSYIGEEDTSTPNINNVGYINPLPVVNKMPLIGSKRPDIFTTSKQQTFLGSKLLITSRLQ